MRRIIDRAIGVLARLLTRGFYRRVEFEGVVALRRHGPRLVVASHFNGFVDVIVVIAALGRLPRFVGKATLGDVRIARPFLRLAGVVLVHRRVDGAGAGENEQAFRECHDRLEAGECVVIFPEGTTHDRESLAPIRTGAARIALDAVSSGIKDLRLIPVGVTYGDKTRLRNDVLVAAAPPVRLPSASSDDHGAVRSVTEDITDALGAVVPGVDDPLEAWAHERAAAVYGRRQRHEPTLADRRRIARETVRAAPVERAEVERSVADYSLALDLAAVDDAAVAGTVSPGYAAIATRAVVTWLLLPLIVWTALINGPAVALVAIVDRFVKVPVTKGTVRLLVAGVAFPASWIVAGAMTVDASWRIGLVVVGQAIALPGLLWLLEGDVDAIRRWRVSQRARVAVARLPELAIRRARVVEAVAAASGM